MYKLQQENKELKEKNKKLINLISNEIVADFDYDSVLKEELNEERTRNIVLQESKRITENILTDFEKRLEEKINSPKLSLIEIITFKRCLEELQELKEGKK